MDQAFREQIRNVLQKRRAALIHVGDELAEDTKELLDGGDVDLVDHAQTATAREGVVTLGEKERFELGELDAALARLEAGSFGRCVACGREIPWKRLEAFPEARTCVDCPAPAA
jgi:DnaK suppressor protein